MKNAVSRCRTAEAEISTTTVNVVSSRRMTIVHLVRLHRLLKQLLHLQKEDPDGRIRALFCGHDHFSYIPFTEEEAGRKPILHTGHFSYSGDKDPCRFYRGWRELTVYDDGSWESLYRVPEQIIRYPGWTVRMEAHVQDEWKEENKTARLPRTLEY